MALESKQEGNSSIDGLLGYVTNLRECINSTAEQIRKQNIKAKQTLFNIAAHFGLNDLNRQKIQEILDQIGVVSEVQVTSIRVNSLKQRKQKQKQRNRKVRSTQQDLRMGDPRKKVKLSIVTQQFSDRLKPK